VPEARPVALTAAGPPWRAAGSPPGFPVWAGLEYGGAAAALLGAAKEHGRPGVLRWLAPALGVAVTAALRQAEMEVIAPELRPSGPVVLVPMPSASAARRRRGFGAAEVVLGSAGLGPIARALRFIRDVDDQAGLSAEDRAGNLRQAMTASRAVAGRRVLLVDDVVTTGSTMLEAARAVRAAGGHVIGAACIAHSVKRWVTPRQSMGDTDGATGVA
jgi:predicted amidophosphoribosyltransferase